MSKSRRLVIPVILLFLSGCVTSGELTTAQEFILSKDTPIAVIQEGDPHGITLQLENELLSAGFDVAPYETAQKQAQIESDIEASASGSNVSAEAQSTASSGTYLPSAVAVTVDYKYSEYPAATYYTRAFFRVMDVRDKTLLASYSLDGSEMNPIDMEAAMEDFVKRLQSFRR